MFKHVLVLAICLPAIFATTGIKVCEKGDFPISVDVAGCDAAPCAVKPGTKAQMTLGFNAPRDVEEFSPKVRAKVIGLWVPYELPADVSVGCDFLNGTRCPLTEGEFVVYDFLFPLESSYPAISVDVELSLVDTVGNFLCALIPVTVTP